MRRRRRNSGSQAEWPEGGAGVASAAVMSAANFSRGWDFRRVLAAPVALWGAAGGAMAGHTSARAIEGQCGVSFHLPLIRGHSSIA